jgi:hypothetical protein
MTATFRREAAVISPKRLWLLAEEPIALLFLKDLLTIKTYFNLKIVLKS